MFTSIGTLFRIINKCFMSVENVTDVGLLVSEDFKVQQTLALRISQAALDAQPEIKLI